MSDFKPGDKVRMVDSTRIDGPSGIVEVLEVGLCDVDGECGGVGHDRTFLRIINDWVPGEDWMHAHAFEKVT